MSSLKLPNKNIMNPKELDSVVLARLIEEVRVETTKPKSVYNRIHNRHNRSLDGNQHD